MLKELLEIEPDNKCKLSLLFVAYEILMFGLWSPGLNFTMALMDTNSAVEKLIQIDPLRVNYYHDLSKVFHWKLFDNL